MNNVMMWGGSESTRSTFGELESTPVKTSRKSVVDNASPKVVTAVYGYIRAVRALGRESVNTVDISRALGISERDVERAVVALKDKGVKAK